MKTTLLSGLVLGAALTAFPAMAEQPAAPASAGPVALTDAQLDQVVGGRTSLRGVCSRCSGSSASNNESTNFNVAEGFSITISVGGGGVVPDNGED